MTQETLKQAISLSRAGKKLEARELLEGILKSDPLQEAAWLWFADTYQSAGRRLQVLDTALHMNPDSRMVAQAREALLVASGLQPQKQKEALPEPQPAVKPPPAQETPKLQDITNLYLAFDSEKRVWRVTANPQEEENIPSEPFAEQPQTEQELLDEQLIALQLEAEKSEPSVEQLQSDQEALDKLIALQLQEQVAVEEQPVVEDEDDELDPDTIVAESFVELLQAELETEEKEPAPDWMDTEARRIEQLISLADKESSSGSGEPPAEPAEALQWVPESEAAEPDESQESDKENQPAVEKPVEDTQEMKPRESSD